MKLLPINRRLLVVVIGSLLLVFLLWQLTSKQLQGVLTGSVFKPKSFPLFYMNDMKTTQYTPDGRPAYLLEAAQFNYYEGRGSTTEDRQANAYAVLEKPLITFYDEESSVWRLSATSGESHSDSELIILTGDVRLWEVKKGQGSIANIELTTQSLTVKPTESFAQTSDPVVVRGNGATMKSTGVKFFIDSSRIEFLSAVRGYYDQP